MQESSAASALRRIKIAHTVIWAFFAGSICAIPILSFLQKHYTAITLIGIVSIEVIIVLFNGMSCPLTAVAARYTDDRRDNFDIYLPEWLARHNKTVFGLLYFVGIVVTIAGWPKGSPQ